MIRAERPRWLAFVGAAPLVALMVTALVNDPGRIGTRSSASGESVLVIGTLAYLLMIFLVLTWCFSTFRYATLLLLLQVVVLWTGGLLYSYEVRVDTTWWDVGEDVFFLVTTLLQLIPGSRPITGTPRGRDVGATA